jgi:pyroglutamyl-peptidase
VVTVIHGFGPFGDFPVNPTELLVRSLGQAEREHEDGAGSDLVTTVLPVSKDRVPGMITELMSQHRPDLWLGMGLAAGRTALSIEAVAVNLMHWPASQADADGQSADRRPVAEDGPDAYLTTVPVEDILRAWREHGIPGYLSHSAGSYLCNMSFYLAAKAASELGLPTMVGFLHVPLLPELVDSPERQPSMAMALQAKGLECVIEACRTATTRAGLYLGSGA